jgi:hypothetical protein
MDRKVHPAVEGCELLPDNKGDNGGMRTNNIIVSLNH